MKKRSLWLIIIFVIGILLLAFVTLAWYNVIPPIYGLKSKSEDGSKSVTLAPNEEKAILNRTQRADFHYFLNFSLTSNEPIEVSVHIDGDEVFRENGTSISEERSGSLLPTFIGFKNASVLMNTTNWAQDPAELYLDWNFTSQYREGSSISLSLILTSFTLLFIDVIIVVVTVIPSRFSSVKRAFRKRSLRRKTEKRPE